jgi:hypothetical protein
MLELVLLILAGRLKDHQTLLLRGEFQIDIIILTVFFICCQVVVSLGGLELLLGFIQVNAGEIMAVRMAMLFEFIGSWFWPQG